MIKLLGKKIKWGRSEGEEGRREGEAKRKEGKKGNERVDVRKGREWIFFPFCLGLPSSSLLLFVSFFPVPFYNLQGVSKKTLFWFF